MSEQISVAQLLRFERHPDRYDRYFFRRFVRTQLLIFTPAALVVAPINLVHGKTPTLGLSGLNTLGWANVGLRHVAGSLPQRSNHSLCMFPYIREGIQ